VYESREAGEAAQEAPQIAKEALGQVGRFQAIAPRLEPGPQESHGSRVSPPELVDHFRLGARPAPHKVQGPVLGLLQALSFVDPLEVSAKAPSLVPGSFAEQGLQTLGLVTQARLQPGHRVDHLACRGNRAAAIGHDQRNFLQAALTPERIDEFWLA
jgi:hypothetical protein